MATGDHDGAGVPAGSPDETIVKLERLLRVGLQ